MSREIMQQALEALKNGKRVREGEGGTQYQPDLEEKTIAALEAELAKPEQEPVAWVTRRTGDGGVVLSGYETCEPTDYDATPVYTAPPSTSGYAKKIESLIKERDELRKVLAQPEHPLDKKADNARELGLDYEQNHGFDRTASHMAGEYVDTAQSKAMHEACIEASMRNAQPEQEPIQAINDVIDYLYSTGADNDMANRAHIALKQLQMNLRDQTALHLLYKGDYEDLIAQPEQEPVAWSVLDKRTGRHWYTHESKYTAQYYSNLYSHRESDGSPSMVIIPLYIAPQNKPLIALTDDEVEETFFDMQQYVKVDLKAFARAIEAKLREKNR